MQSTYYTAEIGGEFPQLLGPAYPSFRIGCYPLRTSWLTGIMLVAAPGVRPLHLARDSHSLVRVSRRVRPPTTIPGARPLMKSYDSLRSNRKCMPRANTGEVASPPGQDYDSARPQVEPAAHLRQEQRASEAVNAEANHSYSLQCYLHARAQYRPGLRLAPRVVFGHCSTISHHPGRA